MSLATLLSPLGRMFSGLLRMRKLRWSVVALVFSALLPAAFAEGITVQSATLVPDDDGWQLQAEFDIQFSPRLEEAVNRGVTLYLVMEFELAKPRWYWFDDKPVQMSQTYKISYTPLLRQYRLSVGNVYQNFTRFDEVTRVLSRQRGWHVADKGAIRIGQIYQAGLRMRLDPAQLPKPFQLNAIASSDWTLASDWHRWMITP
jgi:hypothetical protein